MYYLKSRYYDPEVCRFINADKFASTGQGILGCNMYAYCLNNPVNNIDLTGKKSDIFTKIVLKLLMALSQCINASLDANELTTTRNTLINDQNGTTGHNYRFGLASASWSACEAIAIHNAKVRLGIDSTLSSTIQDCLKYAGVFAGLGGSNPLKLGMVLDAEGIDYSVVGLEDLNTPGVYVISYWTKAPLLSSIHTVTVEYDGETFTTYNRYGDDKEYYDSPLESISSGNYIIGYMLGG